MDLSTLPDAPPKNGRLVVAVSGGPDSVALLHLLWSAGYRDLLVAHVDHGLREESAAEAVFVDELADSLGLPCFVKRLDLNRLPSGENLEAMARNQRYGFFRELLSEHDANAIVTAHHADDQVETVLMNIVRGCGLDGLGGMRIREMDLWRPLLGYSKAYLLQMCEEQGWSYVVDASNKNTELRRNALRHEVIPYLKQLNPNLLQTMNGNIRLWQQAADDLRDRARIFLDQGQDRRGYDLEAFLDLSEVEQQTVLRELFQQVHGHKKDLAQDHLDQVLKVLRTNVSGKHKEFGPGKILLRQREWFEVRDADQ